MTVKPTFKKGVTLVEKRCQLTQFIQNIVPFCIAIVDGQHFLSLTTAVLKNVYLDNIVPEYTVDFSSTSPLNNPIKVVFMIFSGFSPQAMDLFRELGKRDSILSGMTFLFSTRDLLLHLHDAIALYHSEDVTGWDNDDLDENEEEERHGIYIPDVDLSTAVYEDEDAFIQYRNF